MKNRNLLEINKAIMIESLTPSHCWPKAIAITNYLINRLPTKSLIYNTLLNTLKNYTSVLSCLCLST